MNRMGDGIILSPKYPATGQVPWGPKARADGVFFRPVEMG